LQLGRKDVTVNNNILDKITNPADLKNLSIPQLNKLTDEIREELLKIVATNGGHLASNLGIVELTVALLTVFSPPTDKIVFDTSHQGYIYKMLTGRKKFLKTLRQDDGCCGFLLPSESNYDAFAAGHAGTAISAALGMAVARDQRNSNEKIIALVGDGALGTGVSLEGMNNIIETTKEFIIILNDNKMSIAPNVGALSKYLNRIISGKSYNKLKSNTAIFLDKLPIIGNKLRKTIRKAENITKHALVHGSLFEELGLRYIGPINGHDLPGLIKIFNDIKNLKQPLVIHILTEKGHGYQHAENFPEEYHGTGKFNLKAGLQTDKVATKENKITFSQSFGNAMQQHLNKHKNSMVITAGMCHGTGLHNIRKKHPHRFFDVGIAEEHAVVMAAGMATQQLQPIVVLYATFMQRALDYVFHDVCLQNLPVIFCLDRAGIVNDGATHHGIHDLSFWQSVPNLTVLQPRDGEEQQLMIELLYQQKVPAVIRYPKGDSTPLPITTREPLQWSKSEIIKEGTDLAIWAVGRETKLALEVAKELEKENISTKIVNPRFIIPMDKQALQTDASQMPIVTIENHCIKGGFANIVQQTLQNKPHKKILNLGWKTEIIPWGTEAGIREKLQMDKTGIIKQIKQFLKKQ